MITNNASAPTTPTCGRRLGAVVVANARSDMGGSGRGADPFTLVRGKATGVRASPHRCRARGMCDARWARLDSNQGPTVYSGQ
jgi:hypothetical protein